MWILGPKNEQNEQNFQRTDIRGFLAFNCKKGKNKIFFRINGQNFSFFIFSLGKLFHSHCFTFLSYKGYFYALDNWETLDHFDIPGIPSKIKCHRTASASWKQMPVPKPNCSNLAAKQNNKVTQSVILIPVFLAMSLFVHSLLIVSFFTFQLERDDLP